MAAAAAGASAGPSVRVASHAGSWYDDDGGALAARFDEWIKAAGPAAFDQTERRLRAIISPDRIFILGPSHHHYTKICELSRHALYATPVSPLQLDSAVIASLRSTRAFSDMSTRVDEEEHSIEMQLPFLAHVMRTRKRPFTIVPILVGSLSTQTEAEFAKILAPYFADTANLFVISSDFCHWGSRFNYTYRDEGAGDIADSIERLDRRGMDLIEKKDADGFARYLSELGNTICGRHPIGVLLRLLQQVSSPVHAVQFVFYAQSSRAKSLRDSSVSYASAVVTAPRHG